MKAMKQTEQQLAERRQRLLDTLRFERLTYEQQQATIAELADVESQLFDRNIDGYETPMQTRAFLGL